MDSCCKMNSQVEQIGKNLKSDWSFLEKIYDLLHEGNCLYVGKDEKIVDFKQPDEVMKLVNIKFSEEPTCKTQAELLEEFRKVIKYSVKTNHPHFHNQLFGQMDPIGLAGAWITEALNTSSYTFEVAPVFSLIESEVIRKICEICGYKMGDGIFAPGGSISNMYGMSLARYKLCPDVKTKGIFGMKPLVLFTSEESHYSFKKDAHWLGIGTDNCIAVKTNNQGQMSPLDLEDKVKRALAEDKQPFFVNATAGSTVLGAFDDLNAIADVCEKYKLWLHVDAAHGGSVMLSKNHKHLLKGVERTNSLAWNPHKALGTPLQCSLFITKEKDLLPQCNSTDAKYLFQQDKFYDVSYDTGNKSLQCGRKIDAFKLWSMFKYRGTAGLGNLVDHVISMAKLFTAKVKSREGFRLLQESFQYTNVCFWYIPKHMRGRDENEEWRRELWTVAPKIKEQMVRSGSIMVGYSPLAYKGLGNFIRMVFTCFPVLEELELDFILDKIEELGEMAFNNSNNNFTSTSNGILKNGYH